MWKNIKIGQFCKRRKNLVRNRKIDGGRGRGGEKGFITALRPSVKDIAFLRELLSSQVYSIKKKNTVLEPANPQKCFPTREIIRGFQWESHEK